MARLRNIATGVVVNIHDDKVSRMGSGWRPFPSKGEAPIPAADAAPRGNASREEWAAYAAFRGVAVSDDAKRDEIKAAIAAVEDEEGQE